MRRNERIGHSYQKEPIFFMAPFVLSTLLFASLCSDKDSVNPNPSERPRPQPTPDLLAFRNGAQCLEIMETIEDAYNESGLAPYDGKYYLIANPSDGMALRVLVLTSKEKFVREVDKFEEKLRRSLTVADVEDFSVKYSLVEKKTEGGGAIIDESVKSIITGERGIGPGCFTSPAPATPAAAPSS